jgi:hypothetical protein
MSDVGASDDRDSKTKWWVTGIVAPVLAGLLIWYLTGPNSPFNHPHPNTSRSAFFATVQVPPGLSDVYVHSTPALNASVVAALANGATVEIQCTTQGEAVLGSSLWDWIGTGYVPDADIYTGTNQPAMPTC